MAPSPKTVTFFVQEVKRFSIDTPTSFPKIKKFIIGVAASHLVCEKLD